VKTGKPETENKQLPQVSATKTSAMERQMYRFKRPFRPFKAHLRPFKGTFQRAATYQMLLID
jgi:hypothetical protein